MHELKFYNNILIGKNIPNRTVNFCGSDTEKFYNFNLTKKPDDWYYRSKTITYSYNNYGHRCLDIEKIDFDNYLLFLGDSYTEGIGLELETTYPFMTSKKLNMSYYNLGLGGTGIDFMYFNLANWISNYPKPKYISIYWSDQSRWIKKIKEYFDIKGPSFNSDEEEKNFLVSGTDSGYFETRFNLYFYAIKALLTNLKIPYSNMTFVPQYEKNKEIKGLTPYSKTDYARDLHFGIKTHELITEHLVGDFNDKYVNARDNNDIRGQITS